MIGKKCEKHIRGHRFESVIQTLDRSDVDGKLLAIKFICTYCKKSFTKKPVSWR